MVATLEFPHVTRTSPLEITGVAWDRYSSQKSKGSDEISILVNSGTAFATGGRDVSGDDYLMRWDAVAHKVLWSVNLTATSQGRYGGSQDVEHDSRGNIYVLSTYPGALLRVAGDGSAVDEWYVPTLSNGSLIDHAQQGLSGLAAVGGDVLLVSDAQNNSASGGALYRFDMSAPKGIPVLIPIHYKGSPAAVIRPTDAIYLPPKYDNTVLLLAEYNLDGSNGGVSVLRSRTKGRDKWHSADFLGRIPNPPNANNEGAFVTAAVEIAGSVFLVEEWFTDPVVPGTSGGNRTLFPLVDITAQLEALVNSH